MAIKFKHSPQVVSLGIDPSTHTGLALLGRDGQTTTMVLHFEHTKGIKRLKLLQDAVESRLQAWQPEVAVIEGYGYANKHTLSLMVEIGILIRMRLHALGIPWYIASPSLLKKYATGNGTAKKPEVAAAVKNRWGFTAPSDDVVDAYVLARIGRDLAVNGPSTPLKGVEHG